MEERSEIETPKEFLKSWGLLDLLYVVNEENDIIKYSWNEKSPVMTNYIVITWDKKYEKCKLIYQEKSQPEEYYLSKNEIMNLEKYIFENNLLNYTISDENKMVTFCGGVGYNSKNKVEIKINQDYNEIDDYDSFDNKVLYNFIEYIENIFNKYKKVK